MRPQLFYQSCKRKACKMRLNLAANSFIFGHINHENLSRTFSVNLGGGELPKCIWTSRQTVSFLDAQIVIMHPNSFHKPCKARTSKMRLNFTANNFVFGCTELFLQSLQGEKFQNASELHSKQLRFWTHKSWNCAHNFFFKTCRQWTSRMRLNFTTNSFVFGRINRENAPRTFVIKLERRKLPKCVWNSREIPSFFDAKIEKMRPELFF